MILKVCCVLPSVFVAVTEIGPKVPTDVGVPLKVFPLRESHEGLPVIERSGIGKPEAAIV